MYKMQQKVSILLYSVYIGRSDNGACWCTVDVSEKMGHVNALMHIKCWWEEVFGSGGNIV